MEGIPHAVLLTSIEAATADPVYFGKGLYQVSGKMGLFRRVSREGKTGFTVGSTKPGAFLATTEENGDRTGIELIPWVAGDRDLLSCQFHKMSKEEKKRADELLQQAKEQQPVDEDLTQL